MLRVYLEDWNPPRVHYSIGIDLDIVFEPREHLGTSGHPDRCRIPLANVLLELGTEPWRQPHVFGDARIPAHSRPAFKAVTSDKLGLPCLLADVAEPRHQQP